MRPVWDGKYLHGSHLSHTMCLMKLDDELLTEQEWVTFFQLLDKIVGADATEKEKVAEVQQEAWEHGSAEELKQFVNWFDE